MEFTEDEKKQIVKGFVDIFFRIADKEYQKRVWIRGEGPECDDFTDVTCDFFGECDSIIDNSEYFGITQLQKKMLILFRSLYSDFLKEKNKYPNPDFIDSPEWTKITMMARKVLQAFGYKQAKNIKIKLSKREYSYLCQAIFIQKKHKEPLFSAQQISDVHLLNISEDQANEIRDLCGKQLQIVGFNEKHELTPEGEILDSLIDKFVIG